MPGRTGRGNYRFLFDIADGLTHTWSPGLATELRFIVHDLSIKHRRCYPLSPLPTNGPRCWSDSMFEPSTVEGQCPTMRICAIVANDSAKAGIVCLMPKELFPLLQTRETQISIGELLAVCLAVMHFSDMFRGQSSICFVDNIGVIHNIVNGTSSAVDAGAFTHALHHRMAIISMTAWWEYVPSKSNISDGASRDGIACSLAAAASIPLRDVEFRLPPQGFPLLPAAAWDEWWTLRCD